MNEEINHHCDECKDPHSCDMHMKCLQEEPAIDIRPAVRAFAEAMELKLRKNDHKTGWRQLPIEALLRLFKLEVQEFEVADEFFTIVEARRESVDMANFAMMIWDRLSLLDQDKNRHAQSK